jgi:MFS family permease
MKSTSALRSNRNFLRYWTADVISTLGSSISAIAVPLLALTLGGGVVRAGLIGTCGLIARLICRFPAGHLADRWDRRWMMLSADLIRMICIGSIPLVAVLGRVGFEQLLLVAVIEGSASALFSAAAGIAMRDVVADDEMVSALSSSQASSSTVMLIGPVIGGALFGFDRMLPFLVDAGSYLVSAVLLLGMTVRPPQRAPATLDRRMTAGLRWLRRQPGLLWVLAFVSIINLAGSAVEVGIVITLQRRGEQGSAIGAVLACVGAGAIVGAVFAPRLIRLLPTGPLFLLTGVIWAVGFCVIATGPTVPAICAVLVVLMLFTPAGVIMLEKAVIVQCPREILGRVNTAIGTGMMALASLGPVLIGIAIENLGVSQAWLLLAGLALFAVLLTGRPLLRPIMLIAEPATPPAETTVVQAQAGPAGDGEVEAWAAQGLLAEVVAHITPESGEKPAEAPGKESA